MKKTSVGYRSGFTVVELLIVIVVIGILAAIGIAAYVGVQKKAAESVTRASLRNVTQRALTMQVKSNTIPTNISDIANESNEIQMSIVTSGGGSYYSGLSEVQKAKLLLDICNDLVSEGRGTALGDYGVVENYISACNIYHPHNFQVNGWIGGQSLFQAPEGITPATMQLYKDEAVSSNPDHPTFHLTVNNFIDELTLRYTSVGGTFPVTELYQQWLTPPALPEPEMLTSSGFCIVARHKKHSDIVFHTTSTETSPEPGDSCS